MPAKAKTFIAKDRGQTAYLKMLQGSCPAPKRVSLKEGAQVLLLRNLDISKGLSNGARGIVTGFTKGAEPHPVVRFSNNVEMPITPETWPLRIAGVVMAQREQLPLQLGWAISIHKSQGMSVDTAAVSLRNVFEYGQTYVALSRVRSLRGLQLTGFSPQCVRAHPKVVLFYQKLKEARELRLAQESPFL